MIYQVLTVLCKSHPLLQSDYEGQRATIAGLRALLTASTAVRPRPALGPGLCYGEKQNRSRAGRLCQVERSLSISGKLRTCRQKIFKFLDDRRLTRRFIWLPTSTWVSFRSRGSFVRQRPSFYWMNKCHLLVHLVRGQQHQGIMAQ